MQLNPLFYSWIPKSVRLVILLLMLFVVLCANGIYLGITTNMYSDLGVYAETYTMATNAMYIGMAAGMIFIFRTVVRFTEKSLILFGFTTMLLMNIISATTNSPALTVAASLVLGFVKIFPLVLVYLRWLGIWSKNLLSARVYPFLYFMALAGLYFITWLTTRFSWLYSWQYAYPAMFILLIICILLTVLFIERHPLKKKIPLYQLDIPGLVLFITSPMLINYIAVYGKVEDWFASNAICGAFFAAVITALLFIRRELTIKRPFLELTLFRKFNFSAGLFLFLLLGALTPTTFQSAFTGGILHFESIRNTEINLYLIPGVFAGCFLSFFWYKYSYNSHLLIIIGFAAFAIYHIIMYFQFVNDVNITGFLIPSLLKGFGTAVLYIAIGLYTIANIPFQLITKAVGMVIIVRSFLSPGIFSGLYNYFLYVERNRHLSRLASEIDANNPMVMQQVNRSGYFKYIGQQAYLSALKEISGNLIIFGLTVIILLSAILVYSRMKKRLIPA
jgi:DHA2 family multidrug resistance protein